MQLNTPISGEPNTVVDIGEMPRIKSGSINKSPVLYLRRKRLTDRPRHRQYRGETHSSVFTNRQKEDRFEEPIEGSLYPNHESNFRVGDVEFLMFREFSKKRANWVRKEELVIDGL